MSEDKDLTLDSMRDIKVYQRRDGYRFSMDAVVLHAFVNLKHARRIADLGAGVGVIGLMLAKRYEKAEVMLVELQEGLHELACRNILLNGLGGRVHAVRADIRELGATGARSVEHAGAYKLVVSNPPFRRPGTGMLSDGDERSMARHELEFDLHSLLRTASALLEPRGRFAIVYLPERLIELITELRANLLEPKRIRMVHGRVGLEARMVLVESVKGARTGVKVEPPLIVYERKDHYTDEFKAIYTV